jgi:hypothetical protein
VTFASIIQRMKFFAMGTRNDQRIAEFISTANTISNFDQFAREVFTPQYFNHIIPNGYDLKEIEAGVSQAKKFVLGITNDDRVPSTMILDIFGNDVAARRIRKFMDRGNGRTPVVRNNEEDELDGEAPVEEPQDREPRDRAALRRGGVSLRGGGGVYSISWDTPTPESFERAFAIRPAQEGEEQ